MPHLAILFFILMGGAMILLAIAHEYTWFRRRHWLHIKGSVISNIEDLSGEGLTYFPEIEYSQNGETRRFVSKYGGNKPMTVGDPVTIVIPPASGVPEWDNSINRTLFTLGPLALGALFIAAGLNIQL